MRRQAKGRKKWKRGLWLRSERVLAHLGQEGPIQIHMEGCLLLLTR